jgi:hypothetical protein
LVIEGLGVLDHRDRRGMHLHLQAAFTPQGCCLGSVGADFLTRSEESIGKTRQRANWPIEKKESFRWLEGYRRACEIQRRSPGTQFVSVADSEADIYELLLEAERKPSTSRWEKADFIVRAKNDRSLPEKAENAGPWCYQKLWATVQKTPERFQRVIDLAATPQREARQATLAVRAAEVTFKPPRRQGRKLPQVTVNVVFAREVHPPQGVEPIEWLLLTSLTIRTRRAVEKVLDYYCGRWPIEPLFRTLKTGCRVEELRLESIERLQPCIALYLIVAWRVQFTTMLARECPDLPADALFSEAEWKSVWHVVHQQQPPSQPPRLKTFIPILASLGGYLARRHDPPPGPQAMWIAIRRMTDFAYAWLSFGPGRTKKPT